MVAQRLAGFGTTLIGFDPYVTQARAEQMGVELVSIEELMRRSDFITIHIPKTPETTGMISTEQFAMAKPNLRIVNCSRGGIIDEAEAVGVTDPVHVVELLHPQPKLTGDEIPLVTGLGASPGAAVVHIALDSETAVEMTEAGQSVILVMSETTPGDLPGMMAATGILTANGGSA